MDDKMIEEMIEKLEDIEASVAEQPNGATPNQEQAIENLKNALRKLGVEV